MDDSAFHQLIELARSAVDRRLAELAPAEGQGPVLLTGSVRHALLAPGKRFRPMVTLLVARDFGAAEGAALDTACAVEMIHAASLILDDLPCMDDAGLRRGRLTTHKAFDEPNAILAAVGLLNQAYAVVAEDSGLEPGLRAEIAQRLAAAVGYKGLTAGQSRDLARRGATGLSSDDIDLINHQKTGVLIAAAAEAGALIAGAPAAQVGKMSEFARRIGLAFQIRDDLIDAEAIAETGKDLGKDAGMPTLIDTLGLAGARSAMEGYLAAAGDALREAGGAPTAWRYVGALFEARKVAA